MKIAFFVSEFPALSETFILDQITGLLDRGHEVDIYAHKVLEDPDVHADVRSYGLLDRTFLLQTNVPVADGEPFRWNHRLACVAAGLRQQPRHLLPLLKVLFSFGPKAAWLRLLYSTSPFSGKGPYDIIHCHFGTNARLPVSLRERGALHGKIVTTFHGYDVSVSPNAKGNRRVYAELFAKGDLFLAVSERIRNKLISLGCPPSKTLVHRCGVDTGKFDLVPRNLRSGKDQRVRLLTIARLVEKKGVRYAIEAAARIIQRHPEVEYSIVGDGPLRGELQGLIADLQAGDRIRLLGWKRKEEILVLLNETDILLAPSVTAANGDEEGLPVVLLEALARGVPVISTRHSAIPELIEDGVTGFLVAERDSDALAERLEFLLQHRELWLGLASAGRTAIERSYDINALNDRLVSLYRKLLYEGNSWGNVARNEAKSAGLNLEAHEDRLVR